jgi:hypothetical protein
LALERYKELDAKLRQWLILFGVGLATLFVTQSNILHGISRNCALWIIGLSLAPAWLQLMHLILLKYTNLTIYRATSPDENLDVTSRQYKVADAWASLIWPDFILDLLSGISYLLATFLLILALSSVFNGSSLATPSPNNLRIQNGDQAEVGSKKEGGEEEGSQEESREKEGGEEKGSQEESREEEGGEEKGSQEESLTKQAD